MKRTLLILLTVVAAGCATEPTPNVPTVEMPTIVGDVGDARNRARVHTELAAMYFSRGAMSVALEELRVAVAADPGYAQAHSMFGLVYMDLRENALAESSFQRALQLGAGDSDISHNYGWFLCQTKREDQSIEYFLRAIRNPLYRTPWRSYAAAGTCFMRRGKLKDAEEMYTRALQFEPNDPLSLLQMGQIRYREGAYADARVLLRRHAAVAEPTAESLWLSLRVSRRLGDRLSQESFANQLRRRFPGSVEYQQLQRGEYD